MQLRLIETFIESARRGSFSAAARLLGVSPAAVSQGIRSLEDQLGARLFTRTTRQVRLTPEGERFLARCAPALEALDEAARAVGEARETIGGLLRITSTTAFGRQEILPLLGEFRDLHPGITIDLSLDDGFVDLVADGYDIAIRGGILPENEYVARLLLPVTPLVCASPGYAEARGLPVQVEDIAGHALIGMRSNPSQRVFAWEFADGDAVLRLDVEPTFVVNDPAAALDCAIRGFGLAQLGSNLVLPELRQERLVLALTDRAVRTRGLYAVYPTRRYVPRKVTALVAFLAERFATRSDLVYRHAARAA